MMQITAANTLGESASTVLSEITNAFRGRESASHEKFH